MAQPKTIEKSKQLLVEGRTPQVFFESCLEKLLLKDDIQIQNFGGNPELQGFLGALRRAPGFDKIVSSLAVIRDAENDVDAAFRSVCGALKRHSFLIPSKLGEQIFEPVRISIFILPNNQDAGMIETLCMQSVSDSLVIPCIDEFLACAREKAQAAISNEWKSRAAAFLATRKKPDVQVGGGLRSNDWNFDHPSFDKLKEFLKSL